MTKEKAPTGYRSKSFNDRSCGANSVPRQHPPTGDITLSSSIPRHSVEPSALSQPTFPTVPKESSVPIPPSRPSQILPCSRTASQVPARPPRSKRRRRDPTRKRNRPVIADQVEQLLHTMGITSYEPAVVHQLLGLHQRYIQEILESANEYRYHASHVTVRLTDVRLAVKSYKQTPRVPEREVMARLATSINSVPLPAIPTGGMNSSTGRERLGIPHFNSMDVEEEEGHVGRKLDTEE